MGKMNDLTDFFGMVQPEVPERLRWLTEKSTAPLPKQTMIIPELEAAWSFVGEESPYTLSSEHFTPTREQPFWSEIKPVALSDRDLREVLVEFVKTHLMRGMTPKDVDKAIAAQFPVDARTASIIKKDIKPLIQREAGLLGVVYAPASLYPACGTKGQGKEEVRQANPLYVAAKPSCHSCIHRLEDIVEGGSKCLVFDKTLVFDLDYDEDVWDALESRFIHLSDKFASLKTLPVKERIRKASLMAGARKSASWEFKPIIAAPAPITTEGAQAFLRIQEGSAILDNIRARHKCKALACYMMDHGTDARVLILLDQDEDVAPLKDHAYMLGSLYNDISFFETYAEAKSWCDAHAEVIAKVPYLVGTPYGEAASDARDQSLEWSSDDVLGTLCARAVLIQGHTRRASALWKKLRASSAEHIKKFAQELYRHPVPSKVAKYKNLALQTYHIKTGLTVKEAKKHLRLNHHYATDGGKAKRELREVAAVLASGDHSQRVQDTIKKHAHLSPLKHHVYGHGVYYIYEGFFKDGAAKDAFFTKHSSKRSLPLIPRGQNPWEDDRVVASLMHNALISGVKLASKLPPLKSRYALAKRLASMGVVHHVIQEGESQRLDAKEAAWIDTPLTRDQIKDAMVRMKNLRHKQVVFHAERYSSASWYKTFAPRLPKTAAAIKAALIKHHKHSLSPDSLVIHEEEVFRFDNVRRLVQAIFQGKRVRDYVENLEGSEIESLAPILAVMKSEEGLHGYEYGYAGAFEDCKKGASKVQPRMIVKASKCEGCMYQKQAGHCMLYHAALVDTPQYTVEATKAAVAHAIKQGRMDRSTAQPILASLEHGPHERALRSIIRAANLAIPAVLARKSQFSGPDIFTQHMSFEGSDTDSKVDASQAIKAASVWVSQGFSRSEVCSKLKHAFHPEVLKTAKKGLKNVLRKCAHDHAQDELTTYDSRLSGDAHDEIAAYDMDFYGNSASSMDEELLMNRKV
jgi:hypothetical protein